MRRRGILLTSQALHIVSGLESNLHTEAGKFKVIGLRKTVLQASISISLLQQLLTCRNSEETNVFLDLEPRALLFLGALKLPEVGQLLVNVEGVPLRATPHVDDAEVEEHFGVLDVTRLLVQRHGSLLVAGGRKRR